jgi:signal transduction histidine kinase
MVFRKENGSLILDLSDDGVGYDPKDLEIKLGIGRKSMESRVNYLSGSIQDLSVKNDGCRYLIKIPIPQNPVKPER